MGWDRLPPAGEIYRLKVKIRPLPGQTDVVQGDQSPQFLNSVDIILGSSFSLRGEKITRKEVSACQSRVEKCSKLH